VGKAGVFTCRPDRQIQLALSRHRKIRAQASQEKIAYLASLFVQ
jgi:hypothetical protein